MSGRPMIAIVGATGMTGSRVARHAAEFDLDTVLVGRNGPALEKLAAQTAARQVRIVDLAEPDSIRAALSGTQAVVSCVAPSTTWGLPIAEAAVDAGVHYVDTTGEAGYCMDLLARLDQPARARGVRLVPAVATSSLPADFATALALQRVDSHQATGVSLGYQVRGWKPSAGSLRSEIDILAAGAPYVERGRLRLGPAGGSVRRLPHGVGVRMPVPDAFVISRYCDLPEIEAFMLGPAPAVTAAMMRGLSTLCAGDRARRRLARLAERIPGKDTGAEHGEFTVHATVWGSWGAHTTTASGREVYRSSARFAALVAAALSQGDGTEEGGVRAPSETIDDIESAAKRVDLSISHQTHRPSDLLNA